MMSCRQVTEVIASDRLVDAPWRRRLTVRLHLLMCQHCRRYAAQLVSIRAATRRLLRQDPGPSKDLEEAVLGLCRDADDKPDDVDREP